MNNLLKDTSINNNNSSITICLKNIVKPTIVYDTYWKFATERQKIFYRRMENNLKPWTDDKILKEYKFTNAYRASDRVSQYLIKNVIYNNSYNYKDTVFRILLFKIFNKIETWKQLTSKLGEIKYSNFSVEKYGKILKEIMNKKEAIYSAAYIMASGKSKFGYERKHDNHLALLDYMIKDDIITKISKCKSLAELYNILCTYPTIGKFLGFQYAIDINYSTVCDFSEMDFVVAGPGAISGIEKCFYSIGRYSMEDIIKYMAEQQEVEFERLGLEFNSLWGRPLQLIDCQNIFCETDKYSRIAHPEFNSKNSRTRIKQKFNPNSKKIKYYYPPKWGINQYIKEE